MLSPRELIDYAIQREMIRRNKQSWRIINEVKIERPEEVVATSDPWMLVSKLIKRCGDAY